MTDRELMKMANRIEALAFEMKAPNAYTPQFVMLANEIRMRARLAQPEQQHSEQWWRHEVSNAWAEGYEKGRLQREWQGLTDEEANELTYASIAEIEAKLKEKNHAI